MTTLHRQLDHWPEFEDNQNTRLMAIETVWRDYYTGYRLDNWTKPYMRSTEDNVRGDTHQCMIALTGRPWEKSWIEWQCEHSGFSCPCSYPVRPLLRMRGRCSKSLIEYRYSPKQLPGNPNNMIILGKESTRIEYNDSRASEIKMCCKLEKAGW